ncbi:MAG: calpastatin [Rhizorhabdus sp.]|nr:calpastatin [Rhizorhabdus sp.]
MADAFDLSRFVAAQADVYPSALAEIARGRKTSHWMWFVFPQIAGLGRSPVAQHYALSSATEAVAFAQHPLLGTRLRECVETLQQLPEVSAIAVFGPVDAMKLRSSLTLFAAATGNRLFNDAIDRWFDGERDQATLDLLVA